jgi:hypothetical protein
MKTESEPGQDQEHEPPAQPVAADGTLGDRVLSILRQVCDGVSPGRPPSSRTTTFAFGILLAARLPANLHRQLLLRFAENAHPIPSLVVGKQPKPVAVVGLAAVMLL